MQININIPDSRLRTALKVLRVVGCVVCPLLLLFLNDPNAQSLINPVFATFVLLPLLALTLNLLLASFFPVCKRHWVQVGCGIAILIVLQTMFLIYQNINITFSDPFFRSAFPRLVMELVIQLVIMLVIPLAGFPLFQSWRKKRRA